MKVEQINQGAAAKAGGFLEHISVLNLPRNHLTSTIPAATSAQKTLEKLMQPLYQKLVWENRVKETALEGTATSEKPQCN